MVVCYSHSAVAHKQWNWDVAVVKHKDMMAPFTVQCESCQYIVAVVIKRYEPIFQTFKGSLFQMIAPTLTPENLKLHQS